MFILSILNSTGSFVFRHKLDRDGEIKGVDEDFVKQFLLNGSVVVPTESLLIQTDSLKKLTEKIQSNKTFCFKTVPGKFGWCATCKVC